MSWFNGDEKKYKDAKKKYKEIDSEDDDDDDDDDLINYKKEMEKRDMEIQYWRGKYHEHTEFLHTVILELIRNPPNKPAATPLQRLLEKRETAMSPKELSRGTAKDDKHIDIQAGPKRPLP